MQFGSTVVSFGEEKPQYVLCCKVLAGSALQLTS